MPNEKKLKMCPDPECGKESPEDAETCIGCGIDFGSFTMFDRILTIREKRQKAEAEKVKPEKRISLLESITRKKGK